MNGGGSTICLNSLEQLTQQSIAAVLMEFINVLLDRARGLTRAKLQSTDVSEVIQTER